MAGIAPLFAFFLRQMGHGRLTGPGTLIGPALGAGLIVFLKNFVSVYTKRWLLILGAVYIGVILYAPNGRPSHLVSDPTPIKELMG